MRTAPTRSTLLATLALGALIAGCSPDRRPWGPPFGPYAGGPWDDRGWDDGRWDDRDWDDRDWDDRRGWDDRDWDDRRDRDARDRVHRGRTATLICASEGGRTTRCRAPFRLGAAEVDQRHSDARCDEGRNWGWNEREIWVTGGCRARFRLYPARRHGGFGGGRAGGRIVRCESQGERRRTCRVGGRIDRVEVERRLSDAPCDYGRSWGVRGDAIWVDRGCRADFRVD